MESKSKAYNKLYAFFINYDVILHRVDKYRRSNMI